MFILDRLTGLFFTAILLVAGSFGMEAVELRNSGDPKEVAASAPAPRIDIEQVTSTTVLSTTTTTVQKPTTTTSTTTTTTTTTILGIGDASCPEIWSIASDVGWPHEWLPLLDKIVWAESRCTSDVVSRTKDYGYTQINWSAHHHRLEDKGISRDDLLNPTINLTEALWIAEYARDNYGCWSQPWYMSGDWC